MSSHTSKHKQQRSAAAAAQPNGSLFAAGSGSPRQPGPDPPVDTPGHWVPRVRFPGHKSFGWFECPLSCGHTWQSAHAYTKQRQRCDKCPRWHFAQLMWLNDDPRAAGSSTRDNGKPHQTNRCEACIRLEVGCWTVAASVANAAR